MDRFIGKNSPVLTFKISLDSSEMFFLLEGFKKGGGEHANHRCVQVDEKGGPGNNFPVCKVSR